MRRRSTPALLIVLVVSTPLSLANKVTELDLHAPKPLTVKVASTNGVAYDGVVSTGKLVFRIDADCRYDKKPGFQEHDLNQIFFSAPGLQTDLEHPPLLDSKNGAYWVKTPLDFQEIVLETIYTGDASGKFADPIQACNDELARRMFNDPETPREQFLAEGFSLTVPEGGRLKATLTCNPVSEKLGFADFHDQTERFDLKIECLPSAAAKAKLTGSGAVEIKGFTVNRVTDTITCPGKVPFKATIATKTKLSGQAWLEFLPAGPDSPKPGKGKAVPWSMNKAGEATSTFEQPWTGPAGKTVQGRTRLVLSWKGSDGKTYTATSQPVTFQRRCAPGRSTVVGLAPKIDDDTVTITSFKVDKPRATMACPGKVIFHATISSTMRLSGETWLEFLSPEGRPKVIGKSRKVKWSVKGPGKASSKLEQSWNGPKGKWVKGKTRLVVSWKDGKGRTHVARSKPVAFERRCQMTKAKIRF
ncbi:MAG: hypothetical protein D6718_10025 [Acidobacteria bacterium]|nr:MAG: hypothetical protein D6718_10025 [Acidobacteriota bacterium]